MTEPVPFNPLDRTNLGISVSDALISGLRKPLANCDVESGAGIYALYYQGDFEPYSKISTQSASEQESPIYVGKAVPVGARKGGDSFNAAAGVALRTRLRDHKRSIEAAVNLALEDFSYRCLVVEDIWIPLGESMLIRRFRPVWNIVLDGFGNHDPGGGRRAQVKSQWDTLHPGRGWAESQRIAFDSAELAERVKSSLSESQDSDSERVVN